MLRSAVDLKAKVGQHRTECPEENRLWDLDFENFPLHVCQCHKSRSRSSEVTVGANPPLRLPSCQVWSLYV